MENRRGLIFLKTCSLAFSFALLLSDRVTGTKGPPLYAKIKCEDEVKVAVAPGDRAVVQQGRVETVATWRARVPPKRGIYLQPYKQLARGKGALAFTDSSHLKCCLKPYSSHIEQVCGPPAYNFWGLYLSFSLSPSEFHPRLSQHVVVSSMRWDQQGRVSAFLMHSQSTRGEPSPFISEEGTWDASQFFQY